jgi:hypothetical protein
LIETLRAILDESPDRTVEARAIEWLVACEAHPTARVTRWESDWPRCASSFTKWVKAHDLELRTSGIVVAMRMGGKTHIRLIQMHKMG